MKWPKESTGRALVNCSSGKYRSSPIKLTSLDMSLEHWCLAKSCRCRSYSDQLLPVMFVAFARPLGFLYHASAWKRLGVKSRCGKSQPGRSAQRGLTYTLSLVASGHSVSCSRNDLFL